MSVELLRRAEAKARRCAESATRGSWDATVLGSEGYDIRAANPDSPYRRLRVARCGHEKWETDKANAEHIALWNPEVALAIADWLAVTANDVGTSSLSFKAAEVVACQILGEDA